ncbi:ATP-binding protein [Actinacidiphila glaucinigra]|uniref:ATP-binding protein n=1 Tax=Actinacidiphila glaucinigra TaxID=235986 RepID=UPI0033A3BC59
MLTFRTDGPPDADYQDLDNDMVRQHAAVTQPDGPCAPTARSHLDKKPSQDENLALVRSRKRSPNQVAWRFPADPAIVSCARHLASRQLNQWGLEHLIDSIQVIVSELVTNAVRHSAGTVGLRLLRHSSLTCEVFNTGKGHPHLRRSQYTDEHGRGLLLVAQLSRDWGVRHTVDGTLVWAVQ